ncbi:SAM-dependent methyltransferase, partial [Streptomyces sp. NPDC059900]|uniref:SAM-dependent methyltransferase n=1 Tax=Streptomyces sp. NPDC059900 TaxID=3155816 RepID=UPI003D052398
MNTRQPGRDLDTSRPHSARMYDYFLGGKDHFEIDKDAAQIAAKAHPGLPVTARENRAFMHRATRVLAQEHGIRQWLDIGTGIPTEPNLHQIAQQAAPESRVVYCDNDRIVLAHAAALL